MKRVKSSKGADKTPVETISVKSDSVLSDIMKAIDKDYKFASLNEQEKVSHLPTGSAALDFVLTNKMRGGGWPIGKITELYGNNSTGKSLLGLLALISTMKGYIKNDAGESWPGISVLIDTERSYNPVFFENLGGDHSKLILATPSTVEEVYDFIEHFIETTRKVTDAPITIVWDSLAGTPTQSEFDRGITDGERMGVRGQIHGRGMRRIKDCVADNNVTVIIINQLRKTMVAYGEDEETVGGLAVKYHASMRCKLKIGHKISLKKGKMSVGNAGVVLRDLVGIQGRFQVQKSRFTRPFREVTFDIFYEGGLSPISGYYDVITDFYSDTDGVITPTTEWTGNKPGHWNYNVSPDVAIPFKKSNFEEMLREHPELIEPYNFDVVDCVLPDPDRIEVEGAELEERIANGDDIDENDLANMISQPLEDDDE